MKSKSSTKPIYSAEIGAASKALESDFNANRAGTADIANSITSRLPDLANKAFGPNSLLSSAQGYAQDTIGGKYLNSNPYVNEMAGNARSAAADDVQSYFGKLGRTGSGANMESFARGVNEADLNFRGNIYNQERGMQQQAAGMAPSLNAADYDGVQAYLQAAGVGAELPYLASQKYAQGVGGLLGSYTNKTEQKPIGPQLIKAVGSIASAYASDIRLKTNIERVGETTDGLGVYDFDYLPIEGQIAAFMPEGRHRGVMAHEVAELRPDALGPMIDGYMTVDYSKLEAA